MSRSRPASRPLAILVALALAVVTSGCALFQDDLSGVETHGAREVEGSLDEHLVIRFQPGDEVARMEDGDGGARTEVLEVENRLLTYSIAATLLFHNRYGQRLQFHLDDVRVRYEGDEYSARPGKDWTGDRDVTIFPKTYKQVTWEFELGTWAKPGIYDVTVRGMELVEGGTHTPLARDFTFPIKVPGVPATAAPDR